ncbi:hypothetical protein [Streptomyces sp. NWU339]|uniref:hypothetical protein n=1 Tax=Streptomyces sp. NWU339 TaxID=2185284 RepID=UPI00215A3206|nr:hypothetical protein [Streptomyces sp. NWU339]
MSAPRAPRLHAHGERILGSIRRGMLDHLLIVNGAPVRHVRAARPRHFTAYRPHRARRRLPPDAEERSGVAGHAREVRRVLRTRLLGGVISEYRCTA